MADIYNKLLSDGFKLPNERQLEWFEREKMIFFHFGVNTFTDREWGLGDEDESIFNPTELDVRQWIRVIKEAGFSAAILTTKHHDGFCLWPTKFTEHSIKNSPYKNGQGDIVREFVDACAEFGVKAGFYLSPWDRHEPTWGSDAYNDFYVGQLTELLTGYGKIWEVWWDGAGSTEAVYDWERWAEVVKKYQPDAVIFGSLGATPFVDVRWVGNESGYAGKPCYCTIDEVSLVKETTSELNSGKIDGERFIPAEVDVSIRPGWFYHAHEDDKVRSSENLLNLWFSSVGSNAGFLLNLPPDRRGLIHENDVASLLEFNRILTEALSRDYAAGAKIYASSEISDAPVCSLLKNDGSIYVPKENDPCPEITVELANECEINTLNLREAVKYGQRITGIEAYALLDGDWKSLFKRECVGNTLAERFDTIKTKALKIKITSSVGTSVLCGLSVHKF